MISIRWTLVAAGAVVALAVAGLATGAPRSSGETPSIPAVAAEPVIMSANQRTAYLAALAAIDPRLAADEERAVTRGHTTCIDLQEDVGPTRTLANTRTRFKIDATQARQLIEAVKAWCKL